MADYTANLSDFLGALEIAACDGDAEFLDVLGDQANAKAAEARSAYDHDTAEQWTRAMLAAENYRAGIAAREAGRIADAMALEATAGAQEGLIRAALVGV
jgi:hypothetical protein